MAFTPDLHEAVATLADATRAGTIVQVVEPGDLLIGRMFRPARVVVAG
jgi:molecular chaperone GrpE (heat shock protein)